ncbi:iron-containing alcohol dehydrogenase [Guptibacillus algicola]|uniref:iron-containing alcohol dehydrogenase n=1 Tax=Guptibacillus algicola TaxID=225844 RepID=UPI001CD4FBA1|nr:iron-containing alcohol dehydrogenase [Alkalihalobacillus algicola]MCA0985673.1 iron-containing alcohol dehydrogenase [Alkalihalobacillus algicola]
MRTLYARNYQRILRIISPALPWRVPDLVEGENSVFSLPAKLKEKDIKNVLIVTDAGITKIGLIEPLLRKLNEVEILYTIYDKTVPNPTIENVEEAREIYEYNGCEGFIAFGGGSPIDCAKAIAARISRPNKSVTQLKGILKVRKKMPPFYAVPTTSGTGSEGTLAAVISNKETHEKFAITDHALIPHVAVLDPLLTIGLPKHITAMTGMDALTHAVEAYIGKSTTAETRSYCIKAVKLIFENLYEAYENGSNVEARKQMQQASYFAGLAFSRSCVGYVHSIAHTLSGFYDVPHGLANAVIMPHVLNYYGEAAHHSLAQLADVVGIGKGETLQRKANLFIEAIEEMNSKMDIPNKIEEILDQDISKMIKHAQAETIPLYPVPKLLKNDELFYLYHVIRGK